MPLSLELKQLHFLDGFRRDYALTPFVGVSLDGKLEPDVFPDDDDELEREKTEVRFHSLQLPRCTMLITDTSSQKKLIEAGLATFEQRRQEVIQRWQPLQHMQHHSDYRHLHLYLTLTDFTQICHRSDDTEEASLKSKATSYQLKHPAPPQPTHSVQAPAPAVKTPDTLRRCPDSKTVTRHGGDQDTVRLLQRWWERSPGPVAI